MAVKVARRADAAVGAQVATKLGRARRPLVSHRPSARILHSGRGLGQGVAAGTCIAHGGPFELQRHYVAAAWSSVATRHGEQYSLTVRDKRTVSGVQDEGERLYISVLTSFRASRQPRARGTAAYGRGSYRRYKDNSNCGRGIAVGHDWSSKEQAHQRRQSLFSNGGWRFMRCQR